MLFRSPEVLRSLIDTLKWEDELSAQTRKLVMYPAFVGSIVLLVTFFLMIYLVPQMVGFIKNMGQALPLQTRLLIAVSAFMVQYWWAVLLVPTVLFFGLRIAAQRNPRMRYQIDRTKLNMPMMGPIFRKIIMSRFASTFALMYSSGITILDAIKTSEDIVGNRVIADGLMRAGAQITAGDSLTETFQNLGIFPPLVIRMQIGRAHV